MKNRRGSVLVATVLMSVVVMGLITMLFVGVNDHARNVYTSNNQAKAMAAAEASVNIALRRLDASDDAAIYGIGDWDEGDRKSVV